MDGMPDIKFWVSSKRLHGGFTWRNDFYQSSIDESEPSDELIKDLKHKFSKLSVKNKRSKLIALAAGIKK